MKIEDYALIGDCRTAALVGRNGSIDWLCWPRFDSPACFAALLGTGDNGFWRISPTKPFRSRRAYRPGTLVLETEFETDGGAVTLVATDIGVSQSIASEHNGVTSGGAVSMTATACNVAVASIDTTGSSNGGAVTWSATGSVTANGALSAPASESCLKR